MMSSKGKVVMDNVRKLLTKAQAEYEAVAELKAREMTPIEERMRRKTMSKRYDVVVGNELVATIEAESLYDAERQARELTVDQLGISFRVEAGFSLEMEKDKELHMYLVPVEWRMCGVLEVVAKSIDEAIEMVKQDMDAESEEFELPEDDMYVSGSLQLTKGYTKEEIMEVFNRV